MSNYYDLLGIQSDASIEEIKRAYRKLASKTHPDKDKKPDADVRFRSLQEAYETLKDEAKRKQYNNQIGQPVPIRGKDLKVSIEVNIEEVIKGVKKTISLTRKTLCPLCNGTGSTNKTRKKCNCCGGKGLRGYDLLLGKRKKCPICAGTGSIPDGNECPDCKGKALILETFKHTIKLRPLTETYIIPNLGHYSIGLKNPGDLNIDLIIYQNPAYSVHGLNVFGKINISPAQAIIGDIIPIIIFGRKIQVKIPPGIQNNSTIHKESGGICFEGKTGSLRLKVNIVFPIALSNEEKELYQKILDIERNETCPKILMP